MTGSSWPDSRPRRPIRRSGRSWATSTPTSPTTSGSGPRASCRIPCPPPSGRSCSIKSSPSKHRSRLLASLSPIGGEGRVRGRTRGRGVNYTFNWSVLWTGQSGEWLLSGLLMTLKLSVALRTVAFRPLRVLATFYVEFFRNVPLLVWMFFWYFAVSPSLHDTQREWLNDHSLEFWAAVVALGVYSGARFSEVLRSGIQAIPKTQMEASIASGLTVFQAYRYVILPIALRLIIPPATSESLNLLKNSSLALTISVAELTFQTRQIETYTAKAIEALTAGTLIYLVLCVSLAGAMSAVERCYAIPGLIARVGGPG